MLVELLASRTSEEFYFYKYMITKICLTCGKKFEVQFYRKDTAKFCSAKCHYKFKVGQPAWNKGKKYPQITGKNHPMWKGGITYSLGYKLIYSPNHPFKMKLGYVRNHRLVVEKHIGRYLTRKEVVHHINGVKDDDRIENLYLFKTAGKHMSCHYNPNSKLISKSNLL